jgi:hypothetical protein
MLFQNGITEYLYGPISGSENKIAVLNMSLIYTQLLLLQELVMQAIANGENKMYYSPRVCSLISCV